MTVLLKRTGFEVGPSGRSKMSQEQAADYEQAKAEFISLLNPKHYGVQLVQNIYDLMDDLNEQYIEDHQIACHAGCGRCCLQLVACTTLEMELIINYLKSLPRQKQRNIIKQVKKRAMKFNNQYYKKYQYQLPQTDLGRKWEDLGPILRQLHYGSPCIYLSAKQRCLIYPVRPLDCRSARSTIQCDAKTKYEELDEIKFYFDLVAAEIVWDEEKRVNHRLVLVPLIGWPVSELFYNFFFARKKH